MAREWTTDHDGCTDTIFECSKTANEIQVMAAPDCTSVYTEIFRGGQEVRNSSASFSPDEAREFARILIEAADRAESPAGL